MLRALALGALGAAGLTLAYRPLVRRWRSEWLGHPVPEGRGNGPLKPDPEGLLDLPEGFSTASFSAWAIPSAAGGGYPALPMVEGFLRWRTEATA